MKSKAATATLVSALLLFGLVLPSHGQPQRSEIEALLDRLPASGCQFQRNGIWYGGDLARDHLVMKLGHIRKQSPDLSVDEFIVRVASVSSATQQAYKVRCMNSRDMFAGDWWRRQLNLMRHR